MEKTSFNKIINFAISKEEEAVKFYQDLQNRTKFNSQKTVLNDFENMEKGHINILNNRAKFEFFYYGFLISLSNNRQFYFKW